MRTLARLVVLVVATTVTSVTSEYLQPVNQIGTAQFDQSTLKFVSVYSRHGSRSPLNTFPTDAYPFDDLRYWPDGVGRLTKTGKIESYNLGKQLRSRYDGFIDARYYDNETIFESNACDRDLTSAQLMAAGMYPPKGFQIWNVDLLWQPIGVWVTDYDVDDTEKNCSRFLGEKMKVMNKLREKSNAENKSFFQEIANNTGIELSNIFDRLVDVWLIALILPVNGYPELTWANTSFMNKLFPLAAKNFQVSHVGNEVMTQLIAGPVLKTLIEQLNNHTGGTLYKNRKMSILACHDTTIVSLIGGLGMDELVIPDPASSLIFELHHSSNGNIVQVLYFNHSTTAAPTLFEIPDCSHPCSLTNFTRVALRMVANSGRENCNIRLDLVSNSSGSSGSFQQNGFVLSFIIVLIFYSVNNARAFYLL